MKISNFILFSFIIFLLLTFSIRPQWIQNNLSSSDTVMSFAQRDSDLFAATNSGVFLSKDNGFHWVIKNNGLKYPPVYKIVFHDSSMFAATDYGVFESNDNAENWTSVSNGLGYNYVRSLIIIGDTLYAGTTFQGIFISTDYGANWTTFNKGLSNLQITFLAASPTGASGNIIFAGTQAGIFIYNKNNAKWSVVSNGPDNSYINSIAVNDTTVFSGTGKGIFISNDNGTNWTLVNDSLTAVTSFEFTRSNIFYGGTNGVFRSTNNFTNWENISSGLTEKFITSLIISGNNLIAGTWGFGSGIWMRPLSEIVTAISSDRQTISEAFALEQNYPNPFNPRTNIEYKIAKGGFVSLKVYDILGREVASLVNVYKQAGKYHVKFNASNLPSGIYMYRLRSGSFVESKKLVLLK